MSDSISKVSDKELLTILDHFQLTLANNAADYPSITATMKSDLSTVRDLYNDAINAHVLAQANSKAATIDKNTVRDQVEAAIRSIRNLIKASGVSEAKIAALGLPKSDTKAPPTATIPTGAVDTSVRLRHEISWTDAATPDNKRRPRGSMGAEIWFKMGGPPPTDEKECAFMTLDSTSPYLATFDGADAGKMVHYLIRWRMSDGSVGGWGETVSATITG